MENVMSFDIKQSIVDSTIDVFDMMLSLPVAYTDEGKPPKTTGNLFLDLLILWGMLMES